ncbi:MAG: glycoside hydrolase family 130 protein [Candidatus Omnitrophica bacterium]|nr:glycoside hydrolase family 130 protein [Candidatus Omnitrophota bacterium]MBU1923525.1 glycoside hydrolase family 130 protein [Candidatus Omnitrophota bacterium]
MIKNTGIAITPDSERVIIRPYVPTDQARVSRIASRVMALEGPTAEKELKKIRRDFAARHHNLDNILKHQFEAVRAYLPSDFLASKTRKLLIGACFVGERSYESTALFNPSIVAHPDQSGVSRGSLRIIISLRATSEGHISTLVFRSGLVDQHGSISIDKASSLASIAEPKLNALYDKICFIGKLYEMGLENDCSKYITALLSDEFTMEQLQDKVNAYTIEHHPIVQTDKLTCEKILWLARCNYEVYFDPRFTLSERVLFPLSPSEQNGMEDARFVFFKDDDGSGKYYATYTAYDGKVILPQIMETKDFSHFKMITLNGNAAVNKGMALFPRKINGHYAMISRNDNERLFLMYSDNIHFWYEAVPIMEPLYPWEFVQIGNCGSPIETERGWLLLTHGVGPLRQYSIGAALLDRDDPSRVLSRLSEPLIHWKDDSRCGYVPNVVYSCGSMVYGDTLIIPYALSDKQTTIALVSLREILDKLS